MSKPFPLDTKRIQNEQMIWWRFRSDGNRSGPKTLNRGGSGRQSITSGGSDIRKIGQQLLDCLTLNCQSAESLCSLEISNVAQIVIIALDQAASRAFHQSWSAWLSLFYTSSPNSQTRATRRWADQNSKHTNSDNVSNPLLRSVHSAWIPSPLRIPQKPRCLL